MYQFCCTDKYIRCLLLRKSSNHTYHKSIFRNAKFTSRLSYSIPNSIHINTIRDQSKLIILSNVFTLCRSLLCLGDTHDLVSARR